MYRKCEVVLGDSEGIQVRYAFDGRQENSHMLVFGVSGCGKSTKLGYLVSEVIKGGKKVIELDFSDSSRTKGYPAEKSRVVHVRGASLFTPFSRRFNVYGQQEDLPDFAARVSGVISGALKLTAKQKGLLYLAVKETEENDGKVTFPGLYNYLNSKDASVAGIRTRLQYLADENIFDGDATAGWEDIIQHPKPITVLSLADFPVEERKLIAEMILDDLRNFVTGYNSDYLDLIIVLDECQILRLAPGMPTSFFLLQGRKYGCGVWLATQSPGCFNRNELAQLYQSALILNFQPSVDERLKICKKLTFSDKECRRLLGLSETLRKGEYLASGRFVRGDSTLSNYGTIKIGTSEY